MNNIDGYLDTIYLQEGIMDIFPKISKSIMDKVLKNFDEKDPKKSLKFLKSASKTLPLQNPEKKISKLESFLSKNIKDFKKHKNIAEKVLINSVDGLSKQTADYTSTMLVFASMFKRKNENISAKDNLNRNLKITVKKARAFGADYVDDEDEEAKAEYEASRRRKIQDIADLSVAWAVIVVLFAVATGVLYTGFVILPNIVTATSIIIGILTTAWSPLLIAGILILAIFAFAQAVSFGFFGMGHV